MTDGIGSRANATKASKTRIPLVTQLLVRLSAEQRKAGADSVPHQEHAGQRRRRVRLIAIDDVAEEAKNTMHMPRPKKTEAMMGTIQYTDENDVHTRR